MIMTRQILFLYLATAITVSVAFSTLELWAKQQEPISNMEIDSVDLLMTKMPEMSISGRELDNQMLIHNVAMFSRHPDPDSITSAYVGTSRTKVIRPEHFGEAAAVVGAGNSYNEITYGLLLQAEILRLKFSNLKKVYFETSMLLRRPARVIIEDDHKKYLPLLESLEPLCFDLPEQQQLSCRPVFEALTASKNQKKWHSSILQQQGKIRLANLFIPKEKSQIVRDSPLIRSLQINGERKSLSEALSSKGNWKPEITQEHEKVQRLRDIKNNAPWDGLFDMIAIWGKTHDIEVIFFQPPARSDLYAFQLEYGLTQHELDIERISKLYGIPFINLNAPVSGYMDDWSIFSDEDHLETCIGSGLLTLAISDGYEKHYMDDEIILKIDRHALQERYAQQLKKCEQNN